MPTADTINVSEEKYSFLFKGPVGFGKTLAAASFASQGPVYIFYFDKKSPIELVKFFKDIIKRPELLKNIEWGSYSANNANAYINKLIEFQKYCDKFAIISDSLTSMTGAAVGWSLGFNPNKVVTPENTKPGMQEYQVETSYVVQALDMTIGLPCHNIWTAHPLPKLDFTQTVDAGGQNRTSVTKTNSLVTYGNKIAGLVPGRFTEIYHFGQDNVWDGTRGVNRLKYVVHTEAQGDEYAKTALNLPKSLEITNGLFYDIWKSSLKFSEVKK